MLVQVQNVVKRISKEDIDISLNASIVRMGT